MSLSSNGAIPATSASSEATAAVPAIADQVAALEREGRTWIAFEYSPPKTEAGIANLKDRILRMKRHRPLYVDVTWGAGGSSSDTTMALCIDAQKMGLVANMHLTCTNMPREKLDHALVEAVKHGLTNILALRGDPPVGQVDFKPVETGFSCALDLIRFLKVRTLSLSGVLPLQRHHTSKNATFYLTLFLNKKCNTTDPVGRRILDYLRRLP